MPPPWFCGAKLLVPPQICRSTLSALSILFVLGRIRERPGLVLGQAPDKGLPAPDAVIFLAMTPEAAALRGGYGNERYEKVHLLKHATQP